MLSFKIWMQLVHSNPKEFCAVGVEKALCLVILRQLRETPL